MPDLIENGLYVKNTGPEFNTLKAIFTKEERPFEKFCPMPIELASAMPDLDLLIKTTERTRLRFEDWYPKVNKLIEELQSLGLNIPIHKDLNFQDFQEIFLQDQAKQKKQMQQILKNWLNPQDEEKNLNKFGAKDWHDWRVINWGTKSDAYDLQVIYSGEDEFCIQFLTANHPPSAIYNKLGIDFPSCTIMVFAWSMEADFISCASKNSLQAWNEENLGKVLTEKQQLLDPLPKPSKDFYEFAKQFKTPLPDWLIEPQEDPPLTLKHQAAI